jgi:hypothetical protein
MHVGCLILNICTLHMIQTLIRIEHLYPGREMPFCKREQPNLHAAPPKCPSAAIEHCKMRSPLIASDSEGIIRLVLEGVDGPPTSMRL